MNSKTTTRRAIRHLIAYGTLASLVACGASDERHADRDDIAPDAPTSPGREPKPENADSYGDITSDPLPEGETNDPDDACAQLVCGGQTCSDGICNRMAWTMQLYGDYDGEVGGVAMAPDGDVIVVGSFAGTIDTLDGPISSVGGPDVLVAKVAWSGELRWARRYGQEGAQRATAVDVDDDGRIAIGGELEGDLIAGEKVVSSAGGTDGFIALLNQDGEMRWAKTIGDTVLDDGSAEAEHQTVAAVKLMPGGGIAAGGSFFGDVTIGADHHVSDGEDSFVVQSDTYGKLFWSRAIGGPGDQRLTSLDVNGDGRIFLGGAFTNVAVLGPHKLEAQGSEDIFAAALDAEGSFAWTRGFGSVDSERLTSLSLDGEGDLVVAGTFYKALAFGSQPNQMIVGEGGSDGFVARLHVQDGDYVHARALNGPLWEQPTSVSAHGQDVAVVGSFSGAMDLDVGTMVTVDEDAFVGDLDADLDGIWSQRYGALGSQSATAVTHTEDGAVVFAGDYEQGIDLGEGMLTTSGTKRGIFVAAVTP